MCVCVCVCVCRLVTCSSSNLSRHTTPTHPPTTHAPTYTWKANSKAIAGLSIWCHAVEAYASIVLHAPVVSHASIVPQSHASGICRRQAGGGGAGRPAGGPPLGAAVGRTAAARAAPVLHAARSSGRRSRETRTSYSTTRPSYGSSVHSGREEVGASEVRGQEGRGEEGRADEVQSSRQPAAHTDTHTEKGLKHLHTEKELKHVTSLSKPLYAARRQRGSGLGRAFSLSVPPPASKSSAGIMLHTHPPFTGSRHTTAARNTTAPPHAHAPGRNEKEKEKENGKERDDGRQRQRQQPEVPNCVKCTCFICPQIGSDVLKAQATRGVTRRCEAKAYRTRRDGDGGGGRSSEYAVRSTAGERSRMQQPRSRAESKRPEERTRRDERRPTERPTTLITALSSSLRSSSSRPSSAPAAPIFRRF